MPISHVSKPMGRKAMKISMSNISKFPGSRAGKSAPKPVQAAAPAQQKKNKKAA